MQQQARSRGVCCGPPPDPASPPNAYGSGRFSGRRDSCSRNVKGAHDPSPKSFSLYRSYFASYPSAMAKGQRSRATIQPISVAGDVAFVPLSAGLQAVIDVADVDLLSGFNWHAKKARTTWVAARGRLVSDGPGAPQILMHHVLLEPRPGRLTDHRDGNGLNNRRKNLREATPQQNRFNAVSWGKHGKGVSQPRPGRFLAQIQTGKVVTRLGIFSTASEAQAAYARAATALHGEFALPTGKRDAK